MAITATTTGESQVVWGDPSAWEGVSQFLLAMQFRVTGTNQSTVILSDDKATKNAGWRVGYDSANNSVQVEVRGSGGTANLLGTAGFSGTGYHDVGFYVDTGTPTIRLYVDGQLENSSATVLNALGAHTDDLWFILTNHGSLAEVGAWVGISQTKAEQILAERAAGVLDYRHSPVFYVPGIRDINDIAGHLANPALDAGIAVAAHPRVIKQAGPKIIESAGTADTTAPTYSVTPAIDSQTDTSITADATASDETDSTVNHYAVVTADGATVPSASQVKAGQDSTGSAALSSDSAAGVANGAEGSLTLTGLSASTAYDVHYVVEDQSGNLTTVTSLNATTAAAPEIAYANGVLQAQAGGGGLDNKTIHYSVWDAAGGTGTPEPGNLGTETKGTFTTGTGAAAGSGSITGLTAGDYWVVLYYFDGTNWQTLPGETLTAS